MANPKTEDGYTMIANELMEALMRTRLSGEERQILDTIIRYTYGYHIKSAQISLEKFVNATGLIKPVICRAISKIANRNIISKIANGKVPTYSLNKNFDTWKPLAKLLTISKIANENDESVSKNANDVSKIANLTPLETNLIKEKEEAKESLKKKEKRNNIQSSVSEKVKEKEVYDFWKSCNIPQIKKDGEEEENILKEITKTLKIITKEELFKDINAYEIILERGKKEQDKIYFWNTSWNIIEFMSRFRNQKKWLGLTKDEILKNHLKTNNGNDNKNWNGKQEAVVEKKEKQMSWFHLTVESNYFCKKCSCVIPVGTKMWVFSVKLEGGVVQIGDDTVIVCDECKKEWESKVGGLVGLVKDVSKGE